jgi:hypothetical protein
MLLSQTRGHVGESPNGLYVSVFWFQGDTKNVLFCNHDRVSSCEQWGMQSVSNISLHWYYGVRLFCCYYVPIRMFYSSSWSILFIKLVSRLLKTIKIKGSRRGMLSNYGVIRCNTMQSYRYIPKFRRILQPPLSDIKKRMQHSTWPWQLFIPSCHSIHWNIPAQPTTSCISLPLAIKEEPVYSSEKIVHPLDEYMRP